VDECVDQVMEQRAASLVGSIVARTVEAVLAISGLGYTIFGSEKDTDEALFLALWTLVAMLYLIVGGIRVRRQRFAPQDQPGPPAPSWSRALLGRRFSFFFTVAASLTGLGAALSVIAADENSDVGGVISSLGVLTTICAWLLLSLGYARFYAQWTDWRFPACPYPQLVDFLYFSMTVGVSFAASDVEVRSRVLRWHVMVHSVISFFYNAIVLAVAINIILGR
jgi:hypothetical protein